MLAHLQLYAAAVPALHRNSVILYKVQRFCCLAKVRPTLTLDTLSPDDLKYSSIELPLFQRPYLFHPIRANQC